MIKSREVKIAVRRIFTSRFFENKTKRNSKALPSLQNKSHKPLLYSLTTPH
jgi:hypothetical protein